MNRRKKILTAMALSFAFTCMAVAIVYEQELLALKSDFEAGRVTQAEYESKLFEIFNRTDKATVKKVGDVLIDLKNNLYGFEVDAGKSDLLSGKQKLSRFP